MSKRPENTQETPKTDTPKVEGTPTPTPTPEKKGSHSEIVQAAARISSTYPLGADSVDTHLSDGTIKVAVPEPVPGIMVLNYISTIGVSKNENSALNRAAANDFNQIRSKISGSRSYQPADHYIYRMAVDGLRDLYYVFRKIYGIIRPYSATNLYRPTAALKAMGLDAEDWKKHAAEIYQWLLDHKEALLPFPTVPIGDLSARRMIFNSALFTDGSIDSSQTYMLNQVGFWSYEEVDKVKGLTVELLPSTWSQAQALWDKMYSALKKSTDVYIIAADIRRAFEDRVINTLPDTPEDHRIPYVELDEIKYGIMNATILGSSIASGDTTAILTEFRVEDADGELICDPVFIGKVKEVTAGDVIYTSLPMNHVNCIEADPDTNAMVNALQFKCALEAEEFSEEGMQMTTVTAMGSEVIVSASIVGFDEAGGVYSDEISNHMFAFLPQNVSTTVTWADATRALFNKLGRIANFDWHPPIFIGTLRNNATQHFSHSVEDIQNYIPISNYNLKTIHDALLLEKFGF